MRDKSKLSNLRMHTSSIQYNFSSLYRNNSHCSVHSHTLLLPYVTVVNVTRFGLSKIHRSATNQDDIESVGKKPSRSDFLEYIEPKVALEDPILTQNEVSLLTGDFPNVYGDREDQVTKETVAKALKSAINIRYNVAYDMAEVKDSPEPRAILGEKYQTSTPTNEGLRFEILLKAAVEGYSLNAILFIMVGDSYDTTYLTQKYPSVFIDINDTIKDGEVFKLFTHDGKIAGFLNESDAMSRDLVLEEFLKGTYNDKVIFCHSSDQFVSLPVQTYTVIYAWNTEFNRFITELIPRIGNKFSSWEELYSVLALLMYNYLDASLLRMNIKQRHDWLVGKLLQESK